MIYMIDTEVACEMCKKVERFKLAMKLNEQRMFVLDRYAKALPEDWQEHHDYQFVSIYCGECSHKHLNSW